ncbi:hypothetical protein ACWD48_34035, partial [Streptomyces sp. NPDC002519]
CPLGVCLTSYVPTRHKIRTLPDQDHTTEATLGAGLTAAGKAVWCEIAFSSERACLRIERAFKALECYQGAAGKPVLQGGKRNAVLEQAAIELIADLLHWTAARGHDPDDILDRAQTHYEAETEAA